MATAKEDQPSRVELSSKHDNNMWYERDIASKLRPETREMLETYAGIPADQQIAHISEIRDRAFAIAPYPSVGLLTWLNPYITLHPSCSKILSILKSGSTILDCGCFIAPDLRYLASQGAPTNRMFGTDLQSRFFELGFEFYRDRSKFEGRFIAADGRAPVSETGLKGLVGEVDVLWVPKFLHLFSRAEQIEVAVNLTGLLKRKTGSLFVGSQNGAPVAREWGLDSEEKSAITSKTFFMGNAETIREDWDEVGRRSGTKWEVEARLFDMRTIGWHKDDGSVRGKALGYNLQWTATMIQ